MRDFSSPSCRTFEKLTLSGHIQQYGKIPKMLRELSGAPYGVPGVFGSTILRRRAFGRIANLRRRLHRAAHGAVAMKLYLKIDGHEVLSVGSLRELDAVLKQMQTAPDLLITDFQLGASERGSDAIEMIRQRFGRQIPTIVLTGDTSAVPARVFSQGSVRLLNKPVDGHTLAAAVNDMLVAT